MQMVARGHSVWLDDKYTTCDCGLCTVVICQTYEVIVQGTCHDITYIVSTNVCLWTCLFVYLMSSLFPGT